MVEIINLSTLSTEQFKNDLMDHLGYIQNKHAKTRNIYVCLVDKAINEIQNQDIIEETLLKDDEVFCFSLYLGKDYEMSEKYKSPIKIVPLEENNNVMKWNWQKHYFDAGDPFIFKGNIFLLSEIKKLISKCNFENTIELESELQTFYTYPKYKMASFSKKIL